MDQSGYVSNIVEATTSIDAGRKGFAIKGKAEEGRILYEEGIALALSTFQEAQISVDPQTIILAEYTFLFQELQFCDENDKDSLQRFANLSSAQNSYVEKQKKVLSL